jgi:Raf kinase inhibitor-like YbhB/YbcL family protein
MSFILSSPAFRYGEPIPETFTHDGSNVSPPLHWTDPPSGTKSLALIVDDPDAPGGTFVHWVLANLPPDRRDLPEKVATSERLDEPAGAVNGRNSFGKTGYGGPKPPPGPPASVLLQALRARYVVPGALGRDQGRRRVRHEGSHPRER